MDSRKHLNNPKSLLLYWKLILIKIVAYEQCIFCTFTGELQQVTNIFDMTTDCKVTELFCIIDEFCKHFEAENAGNLLEDNSGVKRRRRAASLSDSERYPYAIISGDMPIRFSRELPLTEKEQWVGTMALSSTLRAMTEAR